MASAIERNGTEAQRREYLPRMATKARTVAKKQKKKNQAMTVLKPKCFYGSDQVRAIRTVARLFHPVTFFDLYVVNGAKATLRSPTALSRRLPEFSPSCSTNRFLHPKDAKPTHEGHEPFYRRQGAGFHPSWATLEKAGLPGHRYLRGATFEGLHGCTLSICCWRSVEGKGFAQTAEVSNWAASTWRTRGAGIADGALTSWRCATHRKREAFGKPIWTSTRRIQLKAGRYGVCTFGFEGAKKLADHKRGRDTKSNDRVRTLRSRKSSHGQAEPARGGRSLFRSQMLLHLRRLKKKKNSF